MGLLSKAQTVSKRENEKKESGAPESGASSERTGLLEKAEKHSTSESLLARSSNFQRDSSITRHFTPL